MARASAPRGVEAAHGRCAQWARAGAERRKDESNRAHEHGLEMIHLAGFIAKAIADSDAKAAIKAKTAAASAKVAENSFRKVISLVENLLARLKEEESEEADHKAWCDEQLKKNKPKRNKRTSVFQEPSARIAELTGDMGPTVDILVKEQADVVLSEPACDWPAAEAPLQPMAKTTSAMMWVLADFSQKKVQGDSAPAVAVYEFQPGISLTFLVCTNSAPSIQLTEVTTVAEEIDLSIKRNATTSYAGKHDVEGHTLAVVEPKRGAVERPGGASLGALAAAGGALWWLAVIVVGALYAMLFLLTAFAACLGLCEGATDKPNRAHRYGLEVIHLRDSITKASADRDAKAAIKAETAAVHAKMWCDEQLEKNKLRCNKHTSVVEELIAKIEELTGDIADMGQTVGILMNAQVVGDVWVANTELAADKAFLEEITATFKAKSDAFAEGQRVSKDELELLKKATISSPEASAGCAEHVNLVQELAADRALLLEIPATFGTKSDACVEGQEVREDEFEALEKATEVISSLEVSVSYAKHVQLAQVLGRPAN